MKSALNTNFNNNKIITVQLFFKHIFIFLTSVKKLPGNLKHTVSNINGNHSPLTSVRQSFSISQTVH